MLMAEAETWEEWPRRKKTMAALRRRTMKVRNPV
jgi:hypothetical protein